MLVYTLHHILKVLMHASRILKVLAFPGVAVEQLGLQRCGEGAIAIHNFWKQDLVVSIDGRRSQLLQLRLHVLVARGHLELCQVTTSVFRRLYGQVLDHLLPQLLLLSRPDSILQVASTPNAFVFEFPSFCAEVALLPAVYVVIVDLSVVSSTLSSNTVLLHPVALADHVFHIVLESGLGLKVDGFDRIRLFISS